MIFCATNLNFFQIGIQVERRPQGDGEEDGQQVEQQQELTFIEHRGQWTSQQPLLMQVSISSTFYAHIFCTKVLYAAFL